MGWAHLGLSLFFLTFVPMEEAKVKAKAKLAQARVLFNKVAFKTKQLALRSSRAELLAESATNNDAWGPHGSVMTGKAAAARVGECAAIGRPP